MSSITFILTYLILLTSILGYGMFFSRFFTFYNKINIQKVSTGYIGLYGIFGLILISFVTNLILPHTHEHNLFIFFIGIVFFIYFFFKLKKNIFSDKKYFLFSIVLSIFAIYYFKNHDDFSYYHLNFIHNLSLNKVEFGLGNFDPAYNHVSSLFFFHSLFNLPFTNDYFYFIGPISIMVFANIILINNIFNRNKNSFLDFSFFLSLLIFIFINIFFYRLAEHGTDRSAQILILLIFLSLFEILENKKISNNKLENFIIILTLVITIKSFYVIYSILFLIIYLKFFKFKNILNFFKIYKIIYLSFILGFFILFYNIAYTGCFVYPVAKTCVGSFFWGVGTTYAESAMAWYELWSKAGATPNYRVDNPELYISGFNWVSNWIDNYFFNKVSDTILGLLFASMIFIIVFKPKKFIFKYNKEFNIIFLVLLIFFIEWFYNHPALRYGGYCLLALIIFIPLSIFLSNQKYDYKKNLIKIQIIIVLGITIFISRNINRVFKEIEIYNYKPLASPYYRVESQFYWLQERKTQTIIELKNCKIVYSRKDKPSCKIINGFLFFYKFSK